MKKRLWARLLVALDQVEEAGEAWANDEGEQSAPGERREHLEGARSNPVSKGAQAAQAGVQRAQGALG